MLSCDICYKKFPRKSNLTTHMTVHTGEQPFSCDSCDKSFSQQSTLTLHRKKNPYKCDLCEKCFCSIAELTVHKRFHTGEMPFSCVLCQKSYSFSLQLSYHKKSVGHLKMLESTKHTVPSSTSFVDCGKADIKFEIKEEETLVEDPLSIKKEAENVEETIKPELEEEIQEKDFLSCEQKYDEDRIDSIDIVQHKIEVE